MHKRTKARIFMQVQARQYVLTSLYESTPPVLP
jgi:hypothetical protein